MYFKPKDLLIIFTIALFHEVTGLRDVKIWGPDAVERGSDVTLRCLYELEADTLYSVKWYRSDREFCRFSPREVPPLKVFPIPGIKVNKGDSDAVRLTLSDVTHTTSGRYVCEVSADAPSFHTSQVNFTLHVVDVPQNVPTIRGIKSRYRLGTTLRANCSSGPSLPPANLTWYINNLPAHTKHIHHHTIPSKQNSLMVATSSISFIITPRYIVHGKIKVRCTASIYGVYLRSSEKSAIGESEKYRHHVTTTLSYENNQIAIISPVHKPPEPITSGVTGKATSHHNRSCRLTVVLHTFATIAILFVKR